MITLEVINNRISVTGAEELTAGSQGSIPVSWTFSSDWVGLSKRITFTIDTDVSTTPLPVMYVKLDENGMCYIPKEVLDPVWIGKNILAGACGTKGLEIVRPTVWTSLGTLKPSAVGDQNILSLQPDLYEELSEMMGDLQTLKTQDKQSLVDAINEIYDMIQPVERKEVL